MPTVYSESYIQLSNELEKLDLGKDYEILV